MNDTIRIILLVLAALLFLWLLWMFLMNWRKDELVEGSTRSMEGDSSSRLSSTGSMSASSGSSGASIDGMTGAASATGATQTSAARKAAPRPASTRTTSPKPAATSVKDDLTKIEGIGPKINELMNDAGIMSFSDLGSASIATLRSILDNAGPRFTMHDPSSWARQARLAEKDDWVALEKLQETLKGGR